MKNLIVLLIAVTTLTSCFNQKFVVNCGDDPRVSTMTVKETKKVRAWYVIAGIFIVSETDPNQIAKQMGASVYTIQSKFDFVDVLISAFTVGFVNSKSVTVIKHQ